MWGVLEVNPALAKHPLVLRIASERPEIPGNSREERCSHLARFPHDEILMPARPIYVRSRLPRKATP